tara:strand:- start:53239 stop:53400 length:162 start_codon:yes stop_codon:yes gene_type:complete
LQGLKRKSCQFLFFGFNVLKNIDFQVFNEVGLSDRATEIRQSIAALFPAFRGC